MTSRQNPVISEKIMPAGLPSSGPMAACMYGLAVALSRAGETIARQDRRIRELEKLATTDELTGLSNRRGFQQAFSRELGRVARHPDHRGIVVMIDIDNFKSINDVYGHAAGDAALCRVAGLLRGRVRAMDAAARLGGDEFALILSGADRLEAARRAQMLAWDLRKLPMDWQGGEIIVRASLGLKTYGPGDRADDILSGADVAMYEAKACKRGAPLDRAGFA